MHQDYNFLQVKQYILLFNFYQFIEKIEKYMMEYKYRMLNPAPFSTQSIQFKLSQTYLESCVLLSPNKPPKDSLTYTVSMETIQDQQHSKISNQFQPYFQVNETQNQKSFQLQKELISPKKKNIQEQQPFAKMKVQVQQNQSQRQNNITKISNKRQLPNLIIVQQNEQKNNKPFSKKNILKINSLALQFTENACKNSNNQKMGKIMTRIHSHLKQYNTIHSSRPKSGKKAIKSLHQCLQSSDQMKKKRKQSTYQAQTEKTLEEMSTEIKNNILKFKKDKINEDSNLFIDNFESNPSELAKYSILNKTNCSSSANCSPEMSRRKSDYIETKMIKGSNKYNQYVHMKARQKIYSALYPKKSSQEENTSIYDKNNQNSNIFRKNRFKQEINKKIQESRPKSKQNQRLDPMQIIALKLSITDRISYNNSIMKNKSISQKSQKYPVSETKKQKNLHATNLQKKEDICFENIKVNTDFIYNKSTNMTKKQIRKNKQNNLPKKLFCV